MNQSDAKRIAAGTGDSPSPRPIPSAYAAHVQDGELYRVYDGTEVGDWWWVVLPSDVPSQRPVDDAMLGFTCRMERHDDLHWRVQVQAHFRDGGSRPGSAVALLIYRGGNSETRAAAASPKGHVASGMSIHTALQGRGPSAPRN
ncbi:hypothetical protein [Nannocystis punicea]|uniref:Uncharacterized protein n=1 Tax=Nannocystis punicea TaxID=2995304 RepID=A0ABY7HHG3_9BACT|nr:hypothetical protein [Nannocystis poenicansa]WAS98656.1 hypothetical protein O0S08_21180 [Nannocystis poenicansa]